MVGEGGRRKRSRGRVAVIVTAPPLPPPAPPPAEAPPLPPDPAAPLHHHRPLRPHRPTAAEVAAETAVSAREGHRTGAGRKEKREVATREEGVAEEGGTRRDRRRGGRGARKGGAGLPGAIGSIKIETGRTRDVNVVLSASVWYR